jgi:hypothetical protein
MASSSLLLFFSPCASVSVGSSCGVGCTVMVLVGSGLIMFVFDFFRVGVGLFLGPCGFCERVGLLMIYGHVELLLKVVCFGVGT